MPEQRRKLGASASAQVAANGTATVTLTPAGSFNRWEVARWTVSVSGELASPRCLVYANTVGTAQLIEGTEAGGLDSSDHPTPYIVQPGESLVFVWTGATPGLGATATVMGTEVIQQ